MRTILFVYFVDFVKKQQFLDRRGDGVAAVAVLQKGLPRHWLHQRLL